MNYRIAYRFGQSNLTRLEQIQLSHTKSITLTRPQRTFQPGQHAPQAYNELYSYPKDYRPWTINYNKEGFFLITAAIAWFGYFSYETAFLRRTEQTERPEKDYYPA